MYIHAVWYMQKCLTRYYSLTHARAIYTSHLYFIWCNLSKNCSLTLCIIEEFEKANMRNFKDTTSNLSWQGQSFIETYLLTFYWIILSWSCCHFSEWEKFFWSWKSLLLCNSYNMGVDIVQNIARMKARDIYFLIQYGHSCYIKSNLPTPETFSRFKYVAATPAWNNPCDNSIKANEFV